VGDRAPLQNLLFHSDTNPILTRLVSYYYFLRYGDDYRINKIRSRMGDKVDKTTYFFSTPLE